MKVFYDEVDGELFPKLLIVQADIDKEHMSIDVSGPFIRMFPEDFHDDFKGLTISQGEMLRDHFNETTFLIDIKLVKQFMLKREINPALIYELEYFVMLLDDVEELLQMDLRRFYLE